MDRIDIPCIKYIIDRISSLDLLPLFHSFFQKVLLSDGLLLEHIPFEYLSKVPAVNSSGIDMYSYNGQTVEASVIFTAPDLPVFSGTCCNYCKKILNEDYGGICKTCPRSGTLYANDFIDKEYALLRFAAHSPEHLTLLKSGVGNSRCIFRAVIDLASDVEFSRPIVVSLTSVIYNQMHKSSAFFNNASLEERFRADSLKTHVFAKLGASNNDIVMLINSYGALSDVVFETQIDRILSAKEINETEMGSIIDAIVNAHGRKRAVMPSPAEPEMMPQADLFNVMDSILNREDFAQPDNKGYNTGKPKLVAYDGGDPDNDSQLDYNNTLSSLTSENMIISSAMPIGGQYIDMPRLVSEEAELPLYTPIVSSQFINSLPLVNTVEAQLIEEYKRTKNLPYEIVVCGRGYSFILYSSLSGRYYTTDLFVFPDSLKALFASGAIRKITWQPYLTMSLLKLLGSYAENIHSIFTSHIALYSTYRYGGYEDVIRRYRVSAASVPYDTGSRLVLKYLSYLPSYVFIADSQRSSVLGIEGDILQEKFITDYLGVSYLWRMNYKSDGFLFYYDINCRIQFNTEQPFEPLRPGYLLSYSVNCASMPVQDKSDLINEILIGLVRKKYFKRFNLQLTYKNIDTFVLFCEDFAYDAVKTYIRMRFDQYAFENKIPDFTHISDHNHISPDSFESLVGETMYPSNLKKAQQQLITAHDRIKVSDDRVRVDRRRSGFKQQTDTFPEKINKR